MKGSIGDITFYKSKEGYITIEKGEIDATRIATVLRFKEQVKMVLNLDEQEKRVKF